MIDSGGSRNFFKMVIKKLKLKKKKKLECINITKKCTDTYSFKISFISFHILKSLYDMIALISMLLITSFSMYTI